MRAEDIRLLVSCGLTEAEARTYLSLTTVPEATAPQLARIANVPRNRIYEVLESLQALDLADVLVGSPSRRYRARPPDNFLQKERARQEERLDHLREAESFRERIASAVAGSVAGAGALRVLQGRVAANHEAAALVERAAGEGASLVVAGTTASIPRLNYLLRPYLSRTEGGPKLEIFLPDDAAAALEALSNPPFAARVRPLDIPVGTISIIRDDIEALWILPIPDTSEVFEGADITIHAPDCAFATDNARLIRRVGEAAAPHDASSSGRGTTRA